MGVRVMGRLYGMRGVWGGEGDGEVVWDGCVGEGDDRRGCESILLGLFFMEE